MGIEFRDLTLMEAREVAKVANKNLFVEFYTDWCGYCRRLENDVFQDERLGKLINENFIAIRIDAEKDLDFALAKSYKIDAFPTILLINDADSVRFLKQVGYLDARALERKVRDFLFPERSTLYMMQQAYEAGHRSPGFVLSYIKELEKNDRNYRTIARTFFLEEERDLMNYASFSILSYADFNLEDSLVQLVFDDIEPYVLIFPELLKELVFQITFKIYEQAYIKRDKSMLLERIPEFLVPFQQAVWKDATEENIIQYLSTFNHQKVGDLTYVGS